MLDFQWEAGKNIENTPEDFLICPNCNQRGVYYETMIQGQVCTQCSKEFEGVVTKELIVTVRR